MSTLQERLSEVFPQPLARGIQAEIASLCKVKPASVSAWFNLPEKVSSISRSNAEALCRRFDLNVSAAWLAEGAGPKHLTITTPNVKWSLEPENIKQNQALVNIDTAPVAINLVNNPDFPAIRRVNIKLSAGASGFGVDYVEDDEAPIVFQRKWFDRNGYNPAHLLAVRVANGSMEPGLYDGDTVVINTADNTPKDGEVFAVNYEGELVIKRMVRDAGQWWLASDNPDQRRYPRKVCGDDVFCLGRIVHKQSERI